MAETAPSVGDIRILWLGGCRICGISPPRWSNMAAHWFCDHAASVTKRDLARAFPGTLKRGSNSFVVALTIGCASVQAVR